MTENIAPAVNRERYEKFWQHYPLDNPKKWPHWKILEPYLKSGTKVLEIGSGLRPKIPVEGGFFLEISSNALNKLKKSGAYPVKSILKGIPFPKDTFEVVCAFEILEHLENDEETIKDLARVLKPKGKIFVSFPLHQKLFNDYDVVAGHLRRYEVSEVESFFNKAGLKIEQFSGIDVPWPTPEEAKKLIFLENKMPWLIPVVSKILDSLPFTSINKPIQLKNWNANLASKELEEISTGFFILEKNL